MARAELTEREWAIRTWIYAHFVEHAVPPTSGQIAAEFGMTDEEARQALRRLHEAHTLLLTPGTDEVRMANPFSAVPTPFPVVANGRSYFANCAWDALGIPAMLGGDAVIHARLEVVDESIQIPVVDGIPRPASDYLIHFAVPFRHWYDDQIFT
ncbi:MAG TPA: organomercurial lyase [Thermomicrobiales bacterium]|nr:organomercurial lyase [Thermomicrobiales bacterium]